MGVSRAQAMQPWRTWDFEQTRPLNEVQVIPSDDDAAMMMVQQGVLIRQAAHLTGVPSACEVQPGRHVLTVHGATPPIIHITKEAHGS